MDAVKNPAYLRQVQASVHEFVVALRSFLELHQQESMDGSSVRAFMPSVWPKDGVDAGEIARLAEIVSLASGRAAEATPITNCYIGLGGSGKFDPISAWRTIVDPNPLLRRHLR